MSRNMIYEKWVDIAKGIGIIAVVLGHSGNLDLKYLYWFHMPLFFLLSGYLYKSISNATQLPSIVKKYSLRLLLPYFSFLVVITAVRYIFRFSSGRLDLQWVLQDIGNLLLGGRFIGGWYGPFWFITTLFFTFILFSLLFVFAKKDFSRIILIVLFNLLAHLESWFNLNSNIVVPWNLDVTLISISYFAFGYYAKQYLSVVSKNLFITSILATIFVYSGGFLGIFYFAFNMKSLAYHDVLLDFLVPTIIIISVIGLSQLLSNLRVSNFLAYCGKTSLPIMYLHILPNGVLQDRLGYGTIIYTIIGILFPIFVTHFIIKQFRLTRLLFLGKPNKIS